MFKVASFVTQFFNKFSWNRNEIFCKNIEKNQKTKNPFEVALFSSQLIQFKRNFVFQLAKVRRTIELRF